MIKIRTTRIAYRVGLSPDIRHAVVAAFNGSNGSREFDAMMEKLYGRSFARAVRIVNLKVT